MHWFYIKRLHDLPLCFGKKHDWFTFDTHLVNVWNGSDSAFQIHHLPNQFKARILGGGMLRLATAFSSSFFAVLLCPWFSHNSLVTLSRNIRIRLFAKWIMVWMPSISCTLPIIWPIYDGASSLLKLRSLNSLISNLISALLSGKRWWDSGCLWSNLPYESNW